MQKPTKEVLPNNSPVKLFHVKRIISYIKNSRATPPTITIVLLIILWDALCRYEIVPSYLLPSPTDVFYALVNDAPLLLDHTKTTLFEALVGLAIGSLIAFIVAILMDKFTILHQAINPIITLSQTIPTIAIAPLLVLWLGYDTLPKIVLVILITFFPITVALTRGLQSIDKDITDLLTTMNASSFQIFIHAKLPAAAEQFFSGLRISATYAIVGAVIAEWLGGYSGLGVYMTRVRKSFAYDRMFAVIIVISVLSLLLMYLITVLERITLPWKTAERKTHD